VAQRLLILNAWEERAEDPFRGLRAGPASFSPFLFFPHAVTPTARRQSHRYFAYQCVRTHTPDRIKIENGK